jgi:low temperature requirement protein LtrA
MALAVPHAFGSTGWAFGLGYFVVNLVHSGVFLLSAGREVARARRGIFGLNLLTATLVLVGGFTPTPWRYGLWAAAFALQIVTPYLAPIDSFGVNPAYFVERHGLVILIALGESVVSIGLGAAQAHLDLGLLAIAIASLVIAYFLYWANFGGDEVSAEQALTAITDPAKRAQTALNAYGYAHYVMLFGIIAFAVGVRKEIGHAFGHVSLAQALALGGGVAVFLAGDLVFRRIMGIGRPGFRLAALAGALASIPLALVAAALQLVFLMVVLATSLSIEGYVELRRAGLTTREMFSR